MQAGGSATVFGTNGPGPIFGFLLVQTGNSLVPRSISPGNTLNFNSLEFTNPPGFLALGTAAQAVPFDLGPLGAPMNSVYIDPLVLMPYAWFPTLQGFAASFPFAVPNNLALVHATIYAQRATLVPAANALGIVTGHALEVRLGDPLEVLPLQQLDAADPTAADGALADFDSVQPEYGAVAVRFEGAFF